MRKLTDVPPGLNRVTTTIGFLSVALLQTGNAALARDLVDDATTAKQGTVAAAKTDTPTATITAVSSIPWDNVPFVWDGEPEKRVGTAEETERWQKFELGEPLRMMIGPYDAVLTYNKCPVTDGDATYVPGQILDIEYVDATAQAGSATPRKLRLTSRSKLHFNPLSKPSKKFTDDDGAFDTFIHTIHVDPITHTVRLTGNKAERYDPTFATAQTVNMTGDSTSTFSTRKLQRLMVPLLNGRCSECFHSAKWGRLSVPSVIQVQQISGE